MQRALTWKTGLLSAGLSASGSAGLFCLAVFVISVGTAPVRAHPLDIGFSMAGGFTALGISILFLGLYVRERKKHPAVIGVVHDFILLLVLFVPFYCLWGCIEAFLSSIF